MLLLQHYNKHILSGFLAILLLASACKTSPHEEEQIRVAESKPVPEVVYEIFIRSFADSDGDGIGDLNGITSRLDYIQELGADAIWITPVLKSPTYHKYDVIDYREIDPECGTLEDYKRLISEAHKRGIKIIMDFVVNHTSDQHPWFLEAKKGKDNPYRNYYNWLTPHKIDSLGIAEREKTGDSWEINPWHWANPGDSEKYYGLFWSGMPDLNFDNPEVREEIYNTGTYWLKEVGVDGFRLDAAKHIYPDWEADKSVAFWQEFRKKMQAARQDVYLIGEVWTTPDKVAPYFKGLEANFNIDAGLAIQQILKTGQDQGFIRNLVNGYSAYRKANPGFIDAPILSNHDQTRIGTVVNGDIRKMKLAASLLLSLPGEPYIYYGEEIGMLGDKPDEYIREPFLWQNSAKDGIRTSWEKARYSVDGVVTDLATQKADPNSLFNHYKTMIAYRKKEPALANVSPANIAESKLNGNGIVAFIRPWQTGNVLAVHNITGETRQVNIKVEDQAYTTLANHTVQGTRLENGVLTLPGWGSAFLKQ